MADLEITTLDTEEEPVASGQALQINVPEVDSPHVVVEVVYDTETVSYDLGEVRQDLELKIPVIADAGSYFVRVVSVETNEEGAEKRELIARS